jgi:hypothetical protein
MIVSRSLTLAARVNPDRQSVSQRAGLSHSGEHDHSGHGLAEKKVFVLRQEHTTSAEAQLDPWSVYSAMPSAPTLRS